jgi:hypothetical protein
MWWALPRLRGLLREVHVRFDDGGLQSVHGTRLKGRSRLPFVGRVSRPVREGKARQSCPASQPRGPCLRASRPVGGGRRVKPFGPALVACSRLPAPHARRRGLRSAKLMRSPARRLTAIGGRPGAHALRWGRSASDPPERESASAPRTRPQRCP